MPDPYGFNDLNDDGTPVETPERETVDDTLSPPPPCTKCRHMKRDISLAIPLFAAGGLMAVLGAIGGEWALFANGLLFFGGGGLWYFRFGPKYAKCRASGGRAVVDPVTGRRKKPSLNYCSTMRISPCGPGGEYFERR